MRVVVPYAAGAPKTRLTDILSATERSDFAAVMRDDVLTALQAVGWEPELLSTEPVDVDVPVIVDSRSLTTAVNAVLAESVPTAVVMADLALATPAALERFFAPAGDVVLVPGRGGGTNAIIVRDPDFRVDYHGASYLDHLDRAEELGASVSVVDSHRLATDIDERTDLVELLLHGEGDAPEWLRSAGFQLAISEGRVGLRREAPD